MNLLKTHGMFVSDEPTGLTTLEDFGLRFDIEENFLDDKSNGFQVEDTGLETADSMERLFLVIRRSNLTLHQCRGGSGET